jgi:cobyrinic acid a,c-diamide synthase
MPLQEERSFPRLVIAAPQGRSGKTTVTLGLCSALNARGLSVQPYKKGPDYIDPSWLSEAAGYPCRSLDPFFYEQPEALLWAFVRSAGGADLSIVEGNHGLFDSFDESGVGSTAAVARTLNAPILLVVNATRIGRSVAAIVHGCQTFEPGMNIAGVVLNNIAHGRHETRTRQAVESHCGIPVVGAIPRDENLTIPDRHLGLIPREEEDALLSAITACQHAVERHLDLDMVLNSARLAPSLPISDQPVTDQSAISPPTVKIGVLRDRAFTFYYPENLEALEKAGAELVFIDAFHDTELPPVDALYIGGGFPEMFMEELSANSALRVTIRGAIENKLPVYAECGGLMYLSQRIRWGEKSAEMVGALPCEVEMTGKPQGHGYVFAQVENENPFFVPGTVLRGHEFHNSRLVALSTNGSKPALTTAYKLSRGNGVGERRDGIIYRNVLASYTHLHCGGAPDWATGLVRRAREYRESRQGVKP